MAMDEQDFVDSNNIDDQFLGEERIHEPACICIFPYGQACGSPFLASYFGNNSGTDMLIQYGDLEQNRRNRQLFPPFPLPAYLSH